MLKGFREFLMRGNVVELAVGLTVGVAFGALVKSLVENVLMPPIEYLIGDVNFENYFYSLDGVAYDTLEQAQEAGATVIQYGTFITQVIEFVFLAFCVYLVVLLYNRAAKRFEQAKEEEKAEEPSAEVVLLTEIRDAIAKPQVAAITSTTATKATTKKTTTKKAPAKKTTTKKKTA